MTEDTCIYTVTVRTPKGQMFLNDYINKPEVTIIEEETIEPEEEHRIKIKVTGSKYEISVIEEGITQIEDVEIKTLES